MSKKHYIAMAALIRDHVTRSEKDAAEVYALEVLARDVCGMYAADNPRFDRGRFLAACGVEG